MTICWPSWEQVGCEGSMNVCVRMHTARDVLACWCALLSSSARPDDKAIIAGGIIWGLDVDKNTTSSMSILTLMSWYLVDICGHATA
jgi:hypothetical protein